MTQNLLFRSATLKDKDQFKKLGTLSYGQFARFMTEENWAKMYDNINSDATWDSILETSKGFVCVDDGEIIGMAFLIPHGNPWYVFEQDWSYIRMVGVHPDYAGRGIGRELTKRCVDHAKATHEKIIALHSCEWMDAAMHIYESMGFAVVKELEPRLGRKCWLYTMELE